ncbi:MULTISPECIES: hypothetical protein [unclassified Chryseobacterium]|uniref:hypothetical protein n=1 Tax=unclassified Chryseobacterium TaxID=2593645 RepID=UPI00115C23AF|nr:hypothetical protein [Chryseobacterium sp. ON_d1]GEJ44687.1 hypothetical protein CRS_12950 [Chryseobacterium sp. ON_d1]
MRKLCMGAVLGFLFLGSCAQNKEKREEYKEAHNKDSLRNRMGDSAVANSIPSSSTADTSKTKTDSTRVK